MTINEIIPAEIKINILGKERAIKFTLRNFAAIEARFGISPSDLLPKLSQGDLTSVIAAIWGSTIVFDSFDPAEPLKIKEEIDIEKLWNLDLTELANVSKELINTLIANLPESQEENLEDEETTEKKQTGAGQDGTT